MSSFSKVLRGFAGRLSAAIGSAFGGRMWAGRGNVSAGASARSAVVDINRGFRIEDPDVFVPWGCTEEDLKALLSDCGLRPLGYGSYSMSCVSLGGLSHELGFSFSAETGGVLNQLNVYLRTGVHDRPSLDDSYALLQSHAEASFGLPTGRKQSAVPGFDDCIWTFGSVEIRHGIVEKVGPVEEFRLIRRSDPERR